MKPRLQRRFVRLVLLLNIGAILLIGGIAKSLIPQPEPDPSKGKAIGLWSLQPQDTLDQMLYERPYQVNINADGFRNAELVRPNSYHILAMGDSFTYGAFVANNDTWTAWLENGLQNKGYDVQVLNTGTIAGALGIYWNQLAERLPLLTPDMVIIQYHSTDVSMYSECRGGDYQTRFDPSHPQAGICIQRYQEDLTHIIDLLKNNDIPLVIVTIPDVEQVIEKHKNPYRFIEDTLTANNYGKLINLLPEFINHGDIEGLYFVSQNPDDEPPYIGNHHLTRYGYLIMARLMMPTVESYLQ